MNEYARVAFERNSCAAPDARFLESNKCLIHKVNKKAGVYLFIKMNKKASVYLFIKMNKNAFVRVAFERNSCAATRFFESNICSDLFIGEYLCIYVYKNSQKS